VKTFPVAQVMVPSILKSKIKVANGALSAWTLTFLAYNSPDDPHRNYQLSSILCPKNVQFF